MKRPCPGSQVRPADGRCVGGSSFLSVKSQLHASVITVMEAEHGYGSSAQATAGDGGQKRENLGEQARQHQDYQGGDSQSHAVYHLGWWPLPIPTALGCRSRWKAAQEGADHVGNAASAIAPLQLIRGGLAAQTSCRGGGEVADGLHGIDSTAVRTPLT